MTLYVLMVNDRHEEPTPHIYSTPEKAIAAAEEYLADLDGVDNELPESDRELSPEALKKAGWLFYRCYSCEGDSVWVLPCEVDEE